MTRRFAPVLVAAIATAFAPTPAPAALLPIKTWHGTVSLSRPLTFNHETISYGDADCEGDRTEALLTAFVDVSDYQGDTLRFESAGYEHGVPDFEPRWSIVKGTTCGPLGPSGETFSPDGSAEWVNTSSVLAFYFLGPEADAHFTVTALREDAEGA